MNGHCHVLLVWMKDGKGLAGTGAGTIKSREIEWKKDMSPHVVHATDVGNITQRGFVKLLCTE